VTVGHFRETEVSNFDGVVVEQQVGGLDIAVDDVVFVEVEEAFEDFLDEEVVTLKSCKAYHCGKYYLRSKNLAKLSPLQYSHKMYMLLGDCFAW